MTTERMGQKAAAALVAAAMLAAALIYLPPLGLGFVFDDRATIVQNYMIQSDSLGEVLSENPFRALVNVTFALQHRLHRPDLPARARDLATAWPHISRRHFPELKRDLAVYTNPETGAEITVSIDAERGLVFPLPPARPFRLFNLALHLGNSLLLLSILLRLWPRPALPAVAAAIFLFHPLATEPVNYVTARFTLMTVTFSLGAVLAHLAAEGRRAGESIAAALFVLAMFCKESAALLPLAVFLLDAGRGRPRWWVLGGLVFSAAYFIARLNWLIVPGSDTIQALPWHRYLLVEQRVFWLYLAKVLVPVHLNFDYNVEPRPLVDPGCLILNLILVAAAIGLVLKGMREKRTSGALWAAAGILMCWAALAPTSTFIALADVMREDRAYPLLAVVTPLMAGGLWRALLPGHAVEKNGGAGIRVAAALALTIIIFMGGLTLCRNQAWKWELSLDRDTVTKSPQKARAAYNYANSLKWAGRLDDSIFWFERALDLDPDNANAMKNLEVLRKLRAKQGL